MPLPAGACVSSDQLHHLSHVADGSICDNEDLARIRTLHRLLVHPGQRPQQISAPHVSSHPLDVLERLHQSHLRQRKSTTAVTSERWKQRASSNNIRPTV